MNNKLKIGFSSLCAFLLLAGVAFTPPIPAKADPVTAFIVFVGVAAGAFVAVDAISCDVNVIWNCPSGKKGKNGGGSSGSTVITATNPGKGGKNGTGGTGTGGSASGQVCTSAPNKVCGITSQGTMVNGVCNATTPANNACPAPIIAAKGFYADPALVKSGSKTTLHWTVTNATTCGLTGGGLSLPGLAIVGTAGSAPITAKTVYTLSCINGAGGPSKSANATVNLVPSFQDL